MAERDQKVIELIRSCRRCSHLLASNLVDPIDNPTSVEPRPIVPDFDSQPIMLVGQAPGITEYNAREPFQGQAGQGIRRILYDLGVKDFKRMVYSAAVVRCFPGRKLDRGRSVDIVPPGGMVNNCFFFVRVQKSMIQPKIVITLGRFPLKAYLEARGVKGSYRLEEYVGQTEKWGKSDVVFLPHTSGSSRWLNDQSNRVLLREAIEILRSLLLDHGLV